jgi:hypothetical protein
MLSYQIFAVVINVSFIVWDAEKYIGHVVLIIVVYYSFFVLDFVLPVYIPNVVEFARTSWQVK